MRFAKLWWKIKAFVLETKVSVVKKVLVLIYNLLLDRKGSYIGHDSIFSGIPIFPHGINGVFISGGSKIGSNCVIFQQVTIGSNTIPGSNTGSPTIGDNCYIGAGAKIIGNITIGNNVRIGANCVVFKDVPDNSVVVMPAPRVIVKEATNDNKFFQMKHGKLGYVSNGVWKEETDQSILQRIV
ncbi:serine acetyltransferase [Bacillus sp. AFS096315]|uniref:serine acetyltransferase n=1 Tax=Bacillus sp. AFS096315 TaxID=2033517 RepID=UPI000BED5FC6|nr:serine acetyltransferase [Bacillus sp. AFS096315]PEC51930.1 serine acetyltransferase [Bacillus sp. AFS096315]